MKGLINILIGGIVSSLKANDAGTVLEFTIAGYSKVITTKGVQEMPFFQTTKVIGELAKRLKSQLKEGMGLIGSGGMQTRSWERPDGSKASKLEVLLYRANFAEFKVGFANNDARTPMALNGINQVSLGGNLTCNAEVVSGDASITKFAIAVNEVYERTERPPTYVDIVSWGELASDNAGLKSGQPVVIQGRVITERWKNTDGEPRSAVKVEAHVVIVESAALAEASVQTASAVAQPASKSKRKSQSA